VRWLGVGLIGLVNLFGLYVVFHAHQTPGGGFQGGAILGTGSLLAYLASEYGVFKRATPKPLIELAEAAGFRVTSPRGPARRGGTITVNVEHAAAVTRELVRREIICDYRPGAGIRLSPHFYTTDEELEHAITEMRRIVDSRAYAAHESAAGAAF
jgi:selenocysteine lyase/cysteine desulfurase